MKNIIKKTFVYLLTCVLFFCSLMNTCLTVYATSEDDPTHGGGGHEHEPGDGTSWLEKLDNFLARPTQAGYLLLCQIGAVYHGDYSQVMENFDSFLYNDDGTINTEVVTYDEETDSITMDVSSLLNTFAGQIGLVIVPAYIDTREESKIEKALAIYGHRKDYLLTQAPLGAFKVVCIDLEKYYLVYSSDLYAYDKETLKISSEAVTSYYHNGAGENVTSVSNSSGIARYPDKMCHNVSYAYWSSITMLKRFLDSSTCLGSSFGQNSTITIPVSDLEKDWEKAYNDIITELDGIKESTGERPTQKQIDDAIKKVLDELGDIGGDIGDIGGDIEDVAKTLDDIYKLLDKCYTALSELGGNLSGSCEWSAEDVRTVLDYLKQINDSQLALGGDYTEGNAALLRELEDISKMLSDSLNSGADADAKEMLSGIEKALQDITILMNDRILSLLEELSGATSDMSGTLTDNVRTLEQIKDILARMEEADIDTSNLEEALEKIRQSIADTGTVNNENLTGMKELLSDMQTVLIDIKSGMAVKDNYTDTLDDIHSLLEEMYKLQKIGTALDVADLLTDFAALLEDGDTSFLDRMGTSFSNVANASKEHFPTSIPWDLLAIFTVLKADPVCPSYDVPFSIPALGVDEIISIDLSKFEELSRISRAFLSVLFLLLLIHLTRKSTAPDEGDS